MIGKIVLSVVGAAVLVVATLLFARRNKNKVAQVYSAADKAVQTADSIVKKL